MGNKIEIMPLGGVGEFGMNCLGIRYSGEMIIVDAGMGFPEETPYGVDISIPNFDVLEDYADELTGLFLTHGHEDHIGSVPYLLRRFDLPVYGSRLTLAFVERKLEEHGIADEIELNRVEAGSNVSIGSFDVEFIHASHSLVDCFSLAVETPLGTVIHTGDYKIDESPVIGRPYDLEALRARGEKGVLALLADSTNATVPGRTPSEKDVIPALDEIFGEAEGRLIVTTFSSSIHRLQVVFDLAKVHGRRVCVLGRSMKQNVELAEELGFLNIDPETEIGLGESRQLNDDEVVYLVTGSQGEVRAVMWNLATQSFKGLQVSEGDTVVLSARIIPGNEKRISKMIGAIYRRGGNIIEEKRRLIHVSGHASQDDIRILTQAAQPQYLVPIHGEYRMLFRHREFAKNHLGFEEDRVKLVENGDILELTGETATVVDSNEIGKIFIGDNGSGEIGLETVRERRKIGYSGVISLVITIDRNSGELVADPLISIKGVSGVDALNGTLEVARQSVSEAFKEVSRQQASDSEWLKEHLRIHLKRHLQSEVGARPVIIPEIVEV
ncbi:MAG: ribonuclease J [Pyrinomonadaceae bacterium]|nr:ribonuclease J [Pyrinomonadaceae bacterium]